VSNPENNENIFAIPVFHAWIRPILNPETKYPNWPNYSSTIVSNYTTLVSSTEFITQIKIKNGYKPH